MSNWYSKTVHEVFSELGTSQEGLDSVAVKRLRQEYGLNQIQEEHTRSLFSLFISQFKSIMIIMLFVAATISFLAGEFTDSYVIFVILFLNAALGFYQEYKAGEAVKKLKQLATPFAMAVRAGKPQYIDAVQLVPGDIVMLNAGDIIPADGRLFEVSAFRTDEAILTGESESTQKITGVLENDGLFPADMHNMIFKGTTASNGTAKMVVTAIGMQTEIGRVATLLERKPQRTPLQVRLGSFSRQLVVAVLLICFLVFGIGLYMGRPFLPIFLTAVSLAVAALPEALPAVVTIALSRGAGRMARENALVRQLPAVETLGSVTYICSDKTGTLTLNRMTVEKVWFGEGAKKLFLYNLLLNNTVKTQGNESFFGDSTEVALVKYAVAQGFVIKEVKQELPLEEELPFDSERMCMSTLHRYGNKYLLLVKGAPVKIAEVLSEQYSQAKKEELLQLNREWASDGFRVLFFAYRVFDEMPLTIDDTLENGLHFLGITGLIDPPRQEVLQAIRQCKTAGIKTVMITGDQKLTAVAIAKKLQMCEGEPRSITGKELALLSEDDLVAIVRDITVYARVSPEQKLNIVRALQQCGEFVAMTGDGINDAPSLRQANIGVAMGRNGSDVSKEAAQLILLDDNFATIVKAVGEGRRIYSNLKKFILYVLSCNLGEILVVLFAPIFGLDIPLLPIHILWINLATDGLPGVALSGEPATSDIMEQPPHPVSENFLSGGMLYRIVISGFIMGAGAISLQYIASRHGYSVQEQQAMVFSMLCFSQLGNAFLLKSIDKSIFSRRLSRNTFLSVTIVVLILVQVLLLSVPAMNTVFKTTSLNLGAWGYTIAAVLLVLFFLELSKLAISRCVSDKELS